MIHNDNARSTLCNSTRKSAAATKTPPQSAIWHCDNQKSSNHFGKHHKPNDKNIHAWLLLHASSPIALNSSYPNTALALPV
jgi:hypothetical protein